MILQTDSRYKNINLGKTQYKLGRWGCLTVCLAYLSGTTPDIIAREDIYNPDGQLDWIRFIKKFGGEYNGDRSKPLWQPTIGQTLVNGATHFVVIENGKQLDPLGKRNNYPIYSYRNYKPPKGEKGEFDMTTTRELQDYANTNDEKYLRLAKDYCNTKVDNDIALIKKQMADNFKIVRDELDDIKKSIASGEPLKEDEKQSLGLLVKFIEWIKNKLKKE